MSSDVLRVPSTDKRRIQVSSYCFSKVLTVIVCSDLCLSLSHAVTRIDSYGFKAVEADFMT
jgi:hypothetical protein